jgi:hypothetical protein
MIFARAGCLVHIWLGIPISRSLLCAEARIGRQAKRQLLLSYWKQNWNVWTNFIKICSAVLSCYMQTDGQTQRHSEVKRRIFYNFVANAPKVLALSWFKLFEDITDERSEHSGRYLPDTYQIHLNTSHCRNVVTKDVISFSHWHVMWNCLLARSFLD